MAVAGRELLPAFEKQFENQQISISIAIEYLKQAELHQFGFERIHKLLQTT